MITRRESRQSPKRYAVLACGSITSVVSIGKGERSCKNTGYSYDSLNGREASTACKRALKIARKALREGEIAVDDHQVGKYGVMGVFDGFREASLGSSLLSIVLAEQLDSLGDTGHREPERPLGKLFHHVMSEEAPRGGLDEKEAQLRRHLMLYLESVLGDGMYTGLPNLVSLPGVDVLSRALRACQRNPLSHHGDPLEETTLANFLVWLTHSLPTVLRRHPHDFTREQTSLYTATALFRTALGKYGDGDFWTSPNHVWFSTDPVIPGVGLAEVVSSLERAIRAVTLWDGLQDKGTPLSWRLKYVRNQTGLELSDFDVSSIVEFSREHPVRDSFDEWLWNHSEPDKLPALGDGMRFLTAFGRRGRMTRLGF